MQNSYTHFSLLCFLMGLLLLTSIAYSDQFVIVDMENGDRLTGRLLNVNATNTHFEIEYNGQVLKFPLEGKTLRFISKLENVPDQTAAKHYQNGRDWLDLDFPELAKRQFESALEEFPKFADAHYQLGLLYKKDGDIEKALARFRSILLIDAENFNLVPLLQEIGDNAVAAEDYVQAVNAYQIILTHYPEHEAIPSLTYKTGFLLMKELKDTKAALELLQKAVEQFPNLPEHEEAVYQIGVLQAEVGEIENALRTLQQFVNRYPNSDWVDDARLKRAIIFLQMGKTENAVSEAKRIQNSKDPTILKQVDEVIRASAWKIYTQDLPDPKIQAIAVDGTSLWIGTPKGIAQIEIGTNGGWNANEAVPWMINENEHLSQVPDVRAIAVNDTEVWIGTRNQGIIHYNKNTNQVKNYAIAEGFPTVWIRDIKMDKNEIWFATDVGVVRRILDTGVQFHYHGDPVPNDIHSIALTPEAVWVGTSRDDTAFFDRKSEIWKSKSFIDIESETQIVRFDVVGEQMLFSWYNPENKINGFFMANWDGSNPKKFTVSTGEENITELDDILVTGVVDKLPLASEDREQEAMPLALWLADYDFISIYYPHIGKYRGIIKYPKIVLDDLSIQSILVDDDRIWIGTTKGMLTTTKDVFMIDEQEVNQTTE